MVFLYYVQKFAPLLSRKWCKLLHAIQKYTNLRNLKCYIFLILTHFATKLCNFTKFKMLFLAVVMDFVLLAQIKISSIAGINHYSSYSANNNNNNERLWRRQVNLTLSCFAGCTGTRCLLGTLTSRFSSYRKTVLVPPTTLRITPFLETS